MWCDPWSCDAALTLNLGTFPPPRSAFLRSCAVIFHFITSISIQTYSAGLMGLWQGAPRACSSLRHVSPV
jgi:hypothetical protein